MKTQATVLLAAVMLAIGAGGAMVYNHYQAPATATEVSSFKTQSVDMAEFARKGWIPDGAEEYKQQQERIREGDPIREGVPSDVPAPEVRDEAPTEPTSPEALKEVYASLSPEDQAGMEFSETCRVVECPGSKELLKNGYLTLQGNTPLNIVQDWNTIGTINFSPVFGLGINKIYSYINTPNMNGNQMLMCVYNNKISCGDISYGNANPGTFNPETESCKAINDGKTIGFLCCNTPAK